MLEQQHQMDFTALTVTVAINDKDENFIVKLNDKSASGVTNCSQVLRQWKDFVQLDRLVRSMAPKFDAPQIPMVENATREELRTCMQVYLSAAIVCGPLKHLKELQEFVGFADFLQQERQRTSVTDYKSVALRHVPSQQQLLQQNNNDSHNPSERRRAFTLEGKEDEYTIRGSSVAEQLEEFEEAESILDECFRIMDIGAAGYITLEDMKEFFLCANVDCESLQLRKDELCNRERFAEVVRQALRNTNITLTIDEWIDRYWLQQYRKIYAAIAVFLNWDGEEREFGKEMMNGFDSFELATLMYVLTEAGLRLVNTLEISEWVQSKRHQRSCALTMDQFAHLLDTLSKAIPFSELWLSLLPSSHNNGKTLQLICTYAAIADVTVVEELQEYMMQLQRIVVGRRRTAGDVSNCVKCSRVEEILQKQSVQLEAAEAMREKLMAKVRYLEQQLEERQVELTQLQNEHQHTQMLLEDADLREAEFMEMFEKTKLQEKEKEEKYMKSGYEKERISSISGGVLTRTPASLPSTTTVLQLLPCNSIKSNNSIIISNSSNAAIAQYTRNEMPNSFAGVLNTRGAVAYVIPAEMSHPSYWSVGVFFCGEGPCVGGGKTERLVFRDADGRRSCAFLFKNNELHVLTRENTSRENRKGPGTVGSNNSNSRHVFRLASRRWYTLNCYLNWMEKSFHVSLREDDAGSGGNINNNTKEKSSDKSLATKCGPFAMIDDQVNGISIVDIFPRTELLVCYCNFFLHSKIVPLDGRVVKK